jgi:type I restriction enzyme M protein
LLLVHLGYNETINKMLKANRLHSIMEQYANEDFSPKRLSGLEVGYIYEELLKRFTQENSKVAGDHFTPREVIRLMVGLLEINFDPASNKALSLYDPACGTGGMLSVSKEHMLDKCKTEEDRKKVHSLVQLFGQEYQAQSYGICKMDMIIREEEKYEITLGNSLIPNKKESKEPGDQHFGRKYDYFISNPPFGVTWSEYSKEAKDFATTRYSAGMPPESDGALLFLLTMIEKMKPVEEGGSKICILFNGSPLSNGDCGSGESEIRRYILENDLLEAIVMLPDQMFYNTGIFTYIWVLNNNKPKKKKGKVIIINAREQVEKEPKSFGNKRNRMTDVHRAWVIKKFNSFAEDESCKLFTNQKFSYHKVYVVFHQTDENNKPVKITEKFSTGLNQSSVKKKFEFYGELEFNLNITLPENLGSKKTDLSFKYDETGNFETYIVGKLTEKLPEIKKKLDDKELKSLFKQLKIEAEYTHNHYIEDYEYIPFGEDIEAFLKKEIDKPIIKWEDSEKLGYEILPNKYFFKYEEPISSGKLLDKFWELEKEAEAILKGLK